VFFFNDSGPNLAEMGASLAYPYQHHGETEYQCLSNADASGCPEYELSRHDETVQAVGFGNYVGCKNPPYGGNRYLCPWTWHPF